MTGVLNELGPQFEKASEQKLVELRATYEPFVSALADRLLYRCLAAGLSFKLGGGNVVTLCPPLTIRQDQFDAAFTILDEALADLSAQV